MVFVLTEFWFLWYRVTHLLADLGWVELDLLCSAVLLWQLRSCSTAQRPVEHPKSKSTHPSPRGDGSPCTERGAGAWAFLRHFMQKLEHLRYCFKHVACTLYRRRQSGLVCYHQVSEIGDILHLKQLILFLHQLIIINCAKGRKWKRPSQRRDFASSYLTHKAVLKVHILKPKMTLCSQVKNGVAASRGRKTIQRRRRLPITCF